MADAGTFCPPAWKAMRDDYRSVVGSECIFGLRLPSNHLCSAPLHVELEQRRLACSPRP